MAKKRMPKMEKFDEAKFAAEQIVRNKLMDTPQVKAEISKVASAIRKATDNVKLKTSKPKAPKSKPRAKVSKPKASGKRRK